MLSDNTSIAPIMRYMYKSQQDTFDSRNNI